MKQIRNLELSFTASAEEADFFREAVTQTSDREAWQSAALKLFEHLRQRRSRFRVERLGGSYNAGL